MALIVGKIGGEIPVNTATADGQYNAQIATLDGGGRLTWVKAGLG